MFHLIHYHDMNRRFRNTAIFTLLAPLYGCCSPDTCATAKNTFSALVPVTDALKSYHQQNGKSPDSIEYLFPNGLPSNISANYRHGQSMPTYWVKTSDGGGVTFGYNDTSSGGTLRFSYTGPGMNVCSWKTETSSWKCYGYY